MSTLLVVRHGQASFGAADYDNLTTLGVEQATRLGLFLARAGLKLDTLISGPRRRQIDTARHFLNAGRAAGSDWPDVEREQRLDEYPAEAVVRASLPVLLASSDEDAKAVFGGDPLAVPTDARKFQRLFERIMRRWVDGELAAVIGDTESFQVFAARVRGALDDIMTRVGRGKTVAVFTSAGPTAVAAQMALEYSDAMALKMSWVVANTGICDIKFRGTELTMVSFNTLAHLEPRHITYR